MGWTASLDMGSEKMVMALASGEGSVCHLKGIKIMASQGIEHGVIKDKEKVRMCIRSLMSELMKDREIEVMNVALSGAVLRIVERRIVVPIQKKVVEQSDLFRAEQRCIDAYGGGQDEVVDILPVGYAIDRGEMIADPLGRSGRNLEVTYQVYLADYDYLADIQGLFEGSGIQEIEFYPAVRAYAEAKQYMVDICSATELNAYENKVHFYIELKQTIGNKSGDFLDFKAYEPDMRKLIDNYIMASDSIKIGEFDDLTLLDFVMDQGETMTGEDTPSGQKEGAAEAIENNIRRKMVEKVTVNPKYYEKMSAILDKLIQDRQKGVLSYKELLDEYIKLAKNVDHPEENEDYPESVRYSKAMQALYDNVGGDEVLAIELHKAVMNSKMSGFRGDSIKERRIKRALFAILNDDAEVERLYKIIEKQEEY